jgi:hypothetical protein
VAAFSDVAVVTFLAAGLRVVTTFSDVAVVAFLAAGLRVVAAFSDVAVVALAVFFELDAAGLLVEPLGSFGVVLALGLAGPGGSGKLV